MNQLDKPIIRLELAPVGDFSRVWVAGAEVSRYISSAAVRSAAGDVMEVTLTFLLTTNGDAEIVTVPRPEAERRPAPPVVSIQVDGVDAAPETVRTEYETEMAHRREMFR